MLAPPGSLGLSSRWSPLRTVDSHPSQWSLEPLGGIPVCSPPASLQTSVASRSLSPQPPLWASPAGFDGGLPCFPNSWDLQDKLKPCGLDLGGLWHETEMCTESDSFPCCRYSWMPPSPLSPQPGVAVRLSSGPWNKSEGRHTDPCWALPANSYTICPLLSLAFYTGQVQDPPGKEPEAL